MSFGASKQICDDKRVFLVSVNGDERDIAEKIDKNLPAIKGKYNVQHNNQVAILCRSNSTIHLLDNLLTMPHKIFTDTPLDRDNSEWGRFFSDILSARFDTETYAVDYAERLFSEDLEPEKYHKALDLCQRIFICPQNDIAKAKSDIIALVRLVFPGKENLNATTILGKVLSDDTLLNTYIPASKNEINLMTLHKSKGLEFNIVFHMDLYRWILPNENGDSDDKIQDLNLHYVGITRAIDVCYLMEGTKRHRAKPNDIIQAEPSPFLFKPGLAERRRDVIWK